MKKQLCIILCFLLPVLCAGEVRYHPFVLDAGDIFLGACDFTGDGLPDLVLKEGVYRQTSSFSFEELFAFPVQVSSNQVSITDLDKDGEKDILFPDLETSSCYWYKNNGDDTFERLLIASGISRPVRARTGDLDGDGDLDILCPNDDRSHDYPIIWLRNNGDASFTQDTVLTGQEQVRDIRINDIDGDQDMDIIFGSSSTLDVFVAFNDGEENFTRSLIGASSFGQSLVVEDVDGDADKDIISVLGVDLIKFTNDGSGSFTRSVVGATTTYGRDIIAGDADSDHDIDIYHSSGKDLFLNDGDGQFTRVALPFGNVNYGGAITDITGDRKPDLVSTGPFVVYRSESQEIRDINSACAVPWHEIAGYLAVSSLLDPGRIVSQWTVSPDSIRWYSRSGCSFAVNQAGGAYEIRGSVLGQPCYAWSGDGTSDALQVDVSLEDSLDWSENFRVSMLFRLREDDSGYLFSKTNDSKGYILYRDDTNSLIQLTLSIAGEDSVLQIPHNDTFWHLLTITGNADTMAICLDNSLPQLKSITISDWFQVDVDKALTLFADQGMTNLTGGMFAFLEYYDSPSVQAAFHEHNALWETIYPILYGEACFAAIQPAVDYARENDALQIAAGAFNEPVLIGKSLSISGIDAFSTTLDGSNLPPGYSGITIDQVCTPAVKDLLITGFPGNGISAEGYGTELVLSECVLAGNNNAGMQVGGHQSTDSISVSQCTFFNNPIAIEICSGDTGSVTVENTIIAASSGTGMINHAIADGARLNNHFNLFSGNMADTSGVSDSEAMTCFTLKFEDPDKDDYHLPPFSLGNYLSTSGRQVGALPSADLPGQAWRRPQWGRVRFGIRKPTYLEPARSGR